MITYEYECWKCDKWHDQIASNAKDLTRVAHEVGVAIRVTGNEPRRIRVRRDGKVWLVPWTKDRGILIGASGPMFYVAPWITARWEFADHYGGTSAWNSEVMSGH